MTRTHVLTSLTVIALAGSAAASAQFVPPLVSNGGFESPDSGSFPDGGWGLRGAASQVLRREAGDGQMPAMPFVFAGDASLQINGSFIGGPYAGTELEPAGSPAVIPGGGPVVMTYRYLVPSASPWAFQRPIIGHFPRRPNSSFYVQPEEAPIVPTNEGGTGHTNDEWVLDDITLDQWFYDSINNFQNDDRVGRIGNFFGSLPASSSAVLGRFGPLEFGQTETGVVFFDDIRIGQILGDEVPQPPRTSFNDFNYSAEVAVDAGITEPGVPVYFNTDSSNTTFMADINGTMVPYAYSLFFDGFEIAYDNDSDGFGGEVWQVVNIYDSTDGPFFANTPADFFPLTWQDGIVTGEQVPYVQSAGQTTSGGTNRAIVVPSLGLPSGFEDAATFSEASQLVLWNPESVDGETIMVEGELVENRNARPRSDFIMRSLGTYAGGDASIVSERDYSDDPELGQTDSVVTYDFSVNSPIELTILNGFTLFTLQGERPDGGTATVHRAEVETAAGGTMSVDLSTAPDGDLFVSPIPFEVGDTIRLVSIAEDGNEDPTIQITLDSCSINGNLVAQGTKEFGGEIRLYVQWADAPAEPLTSADDFSAAFTVTALEADVPVCVADFNMDEDVNGADLAAFESAFDMQTGSADLAAPFGVFDFADYINFLGELEQGCE